MAKRPPTNKSNVPIFVRREVDELDLSVDAFRVYGHLARRAGPDNQAWPSYQSIGEACFRGTFPKARPESLRRKAIRAVQELHGRGIINVQKRTVPGKKESSTNMYALVPLNEWPKSRLSHEVEGGADS